MARANGFEHDMLRWHICQSAVRRAYRKPEHGWRSGKAVAYTGYSRQQWEGRP